jgi:hypothetical protein
MVIIRANSTFYLIVMHFDHTSGVPVRCHGLNIYKHIVSHILHI